jgi:hypothetical protein
MWFLKGFYFLFFYKQLTDDELLINKISKINSNLS